MIPDVRRLAAIDMWGSRGALPRRRIILAEFLTGVAVLIAVGILLLPHVVVLGAWMIGAGLNYIPLAGYALLLSRPGALDSELSAVDVGPELRRYGVLQLWIFVPLSIVVFALIQWPRSRS
jgi:hypothetical protein